MPGAIDLVNRRDFWDDLGVRQEYLRQWFGAPRQAAELAPVAAPDGCAPCPVPWLGRHILIEGHWFDGEGRCWVPGD